VGHACQQFAHRADVGSAGKGEPAADKRTEGQEPRRDGDAQRDAGQNEETGDKADLALEGPSGHGTTDDWIARADPGSSTGIEDGEVREVGLQESGCKAGARSGLADEDDGAVGVEVGGTELNLIERDVDGAGQVAARELGAGADVNELGGAAAGLPGFPGGVVDDCGCGHEVPLLGKSAVLGKRVRRRGQLACFQPLAADFVVRAGTIEAVSNSFEIGPVQVGTGRLFLIAGPCVIESEAHVRKMAEAIQRITSDLGVPYIFKASYDKANRTSVKSFRGPGLKEGAAILRRLATDTGLPVLTDVHEPAHCEEAAEAVDVLQIPAFLCRQTDLLVAAGKTGRAVNIKKGQFVAPWDMQHPVEKVRSTGNERVFLTERGASFGYNTLVVDYRSLPVMRKMAPVVFDGTHSVQQPSAANGVSGGQPEFIPLLARAAVAAGVDGLFLEVHDDPANAKSDGANALRLDLLRPLLERLLAIQEAATGSKS